MERIKSLGRYEKTLLVLMLIMVLVFSVIYPMTIAREGFYYKDSILEPAEKNGSTTYSGEIHGKQAVFTVSTDKTVTFQYGDKLYGPYTAKEDATAVPKDRDMYGAMKGIELTCKEEIIFRGGIYEAREFQWFFSEDGEPLSMVEIGISGDGTVTDEHGNIIDPMEPSVATIYNLTQGPALTHKGSWINWFFCVLICIFTAFSILYADELFRFGISFKVSNPHDVEPSDWAIACRYAGWTALPVFALVLFIQGLQ